MEAEPENAQTLLMQEEGPHGEEKQERKVEENSEEQMENGHQEEGAGEMQGASEENPMCVGSLPAAQCAEYSIVPQQTPEKQPST